MNNAWMHYFRGILLGTVSVDEGHFKYNALRGQNESFRPFSVWESAITDLLEKGFPEQTQYERVTCFKSYDTDIECWEVGANDSACLHCITQKKEPIAFYINSGLGTFYLVKSGSERVTPLAEWPEAPYETGDSYETYISMNDGTRLSTEIFLPRKKYPDEKFPVIFSRTPYGRNRIRETERLWIHYGYAVVLQDVRGRETSEGNFIGMLYEKSDGNDSLNWISSQTWCNGTIGSIGGSYGGYVQWAMAASGNKALKAIVSMVTAGSPFYDIERLSGGYNMGIMDWNLMMSAKTPLFDLPQIDWGKSYTPVPLQDVPMKYGGRDVAFWNEYMQHSHYDRFWKEMTFSDYRAQIDVPALVITGWHDGDLKGSTEVWEMNRATKRKNQHLIIGPWVHHYNGGRRIGEYDFGTSGNIVNIDRLYLEFFDRHLKSKQPTVNIPEACIFIEGCNRWLSLDSFPPAASSPLFLSDDAELTADFHAVTSGCRSYIYDPANPAPQLIDEKSGKRFAPVDYASVEKRGDVIVFTSEPVSSETILAGRPNASVYVSSTAVDTDFVVRLNRVTGNGKSIRFAEGYVRCRYRNSVEAETFMSPGEIYCLDFTMPYCGVCLEKGDRIRAEITSAQYGEMFPNTNTGKNPVTDGDYVLAKQTVWFGDKYPSCVRIPVYKEKVEI